MALSSTIRTLRSRDITDSIPFNVGQPSYVSDIWTNTTVAYDVAIGGLPFFYGISNERPYERQTAPYKKQQFDNSKEPGEQTLEGWWIRSQSSFHRGAGITFFDPSAGEEVEYRFNTSQGVDVWTKGQTTLLKDTVQGLSSANNTIIVGANDGTNDCLVVADGSALKKITMATDTPTVSTYTQTGTASAIQSLATNGSRYFFANGTHIHYGNIGSTTSDIEAYNCSVPTTIGYVKQRLFAGVANALHELDATKTTGGHTLPTAIFTHSNTSWVWSAISESGSAVYAAGYARNSSAIYKITVKDDATLNTPTVTVELPVGEKVLSLFSYLGFILIGTNKGARIAQQSDTAGNLVYGPLIFETSQGVNGFTAKGTYVWCASASNGNAGLVRIDLSTEISPLRYAYASDLEQSSSTGTTLSVALIGSRLAFTSNASGVWVEKDATYVTSGFLQTGFIRYGTLEPKNFKRVRARGDYSNGGLLISPVGSDGTVYETAIYNSTIGTPEINIINPPGSQEYIGMRFTLSRYEDPTDTASTLDTTGPTFKGYQVRALPATPRQHLIQLPLYCYDVETDRYNVQVGYDGRSWERIQLLEDLESTGDEVIFQDFTTGEQITVVIDSVGFQRATPPSGGFSGFGGNLTVIVREVG